MTTVMSGATGDVLGECWAFFGPLEKGVWIDQTVGVFSGAVVLGRHKSRRGVSEARRRAAWRLSSSLRI
jgi:hypothetical protein